MGLDLCHQLGQFLRFSSFTYCFPGNAFYHKCRFIIKKSLIYFYRILLFSQNRSNRAISILMPFCFYISVFMGVWIPTLFPFGFTYPAAYFLSTAHPLSRLSLFCVGVYAGVLCVRIQNGDMGALECV